MTVQIFLDQCEDTSAATLSNAQLLKFNTVKHTRMQDKAQSVSVRHTAAQETPLPTYIGLMLHSHKRKKELVDSFTTWERVFLMIAFLASLQQWGQTFASSFTDSK